MKTIYIVTVNSKISDRAYNTIEEAQEFIKSRVQDDEHALDILSKQTGYYIIRSNNKEYRIEDVRVN